MSATLARQGGRIQLEQSNMLLAWNMAKLGDGGFLYTAMEEIQYLITRPHGEAQEVRKGGVKSPGHGEMKSATEKHPPMVCENQIDSCLLYENGTAKNTQTQWRGNRTGAPPPDQPRELTPDPMPTPPRNQPALHGDNKETQGS